MPALIPLTLCLLVVILGVKRASQTAKQECPAPSPCTCNFGWIRCDSKGLTTVPNIQFSDSYYELHMYNNSIEELPANAFRNLPNLTTLTLSHNNLATVNSDAFNGLSQLYHLSLYNNQLQTLPDNVFDPLTELSELDMQNNKLTNFPVKSLAKAVNGRKMRELWLEDSIPAQPPPHALVTVLEEVPSIALAKDLKMSQTLNSLITTRGMYLFNNDIGELPSNAFRNLPNLTILALTTNKLTTIHRDAFAELSQLESFYLDYNQLETLPDNVFDTLTKLSELQLESNKLTDFPVTSLAKAAKGRKMKTLELENNPNLPCTLKELILSEIQMPSYFNFPTPCQVETCPAPPPCTCSGIEVSCDNKELTEVPHFQPSQHYTVLTLSTNRIEEVPNDAFSNLNQLTHLHIFNNKLTIVQRDAFRGLSQLVYLDFGNNQLETLPDTVFDPLTKLSKLFIDNNKLRNFPVKSLAKAVKGRKMKSLYLQENPNLPCNLKEEILSEIEAPSAFNTPSPCGVASVCCLSDLHEN